jgi:hypothetical protein
MRWRSCAACILLLAIGLALGAFGCHSAANTTAAAPSATPLLGLLGQFSAPGVPAQGRAESAPISRNWPAPQNVPTWPGSGLAQHPMLYAGENYNTIFLANQGKVVWTYAIGPRGEIDDVWMLTNGNVLFAGMYQVGEVTPQKQVVWHYDPPQGTEVHTCQPIGLDKVLLVQNGLPPKMMIINIKTGAVELSHDLPAESLTDQKTVHPQFRHFRMTAAGTYIAPFLRMSKVVEYDKDFNPIWTYEIPSPWDAIRLHNGNTLIVDEHDKLVREVSPKSETVWQFSQADLPANIVLHNIQTADRLANGDTVIFSSVGGTKPADLPGIIQLVEVTPDKKVVWVLQDWKDLGPATTAQFLDQPGVPERPGDLQH